MPRVRTKEQKVFRLVYQREWRKKNPDKVRAAQARWLQKNYEKRRSISAKWHSGNREKRYARHVLRKYGLLIEQLNTLRNAQNGCCAICGKTGKLHIDHDHQTGAVRGLLCHNCNCALGYFHDNSDSLRRAITYLGGMFGPTGFQPDTSNASVASTESDDPGSAANADSVVANAEQLNSLEGWVRETVAATR